MLAWLRSYGIPPLLVVTKCDKLSKGERARQCALIASRTLVPREELTLFSAHTGEGREGVWARIDPLLSGGDSG